MNPGNTDSDNAGINETVEASKNVANLLANARRTVSGASELTGTDAPSAATRVTASEASGRPWIESEAKIKELCERVRALVASEPDIPEAAAAESVSEEGGATTSVPVPDAVAISQASDFWVRACLHARKGDVKRSAALLRSLVHWKICGLGVPDHSQKEKLHALLQRGLIWSSGMRDKSGRYILHVRLRNTDPSTFSPVDVVRTVATTIEWTFRNYPAAQTHGILMLGDAGGAGFRNIDPRVPRELAHSFSSTLPVRVGGMCVMNLPWFIRPVFGTYPFLYRYLLLLVVLTFCIHCSVNIVGIELKVEG